MWAKQGGQHLKGGLSPKLCTLILRTAEIRHRTKGGWCLVVRAKGDVFNPVAAVHKCSCVSMLPESPPWLLNQVWQTIASLNRKDSHLFSAPINYTLLGSFTDQSSSCFSSTLSINHSALCVVLIPHWSSVWHHLARACIVLVCLLPLYQAVPFAASTSGIQLPSF